MTERAISYIFFRENSNILDEDYILFLIFISNMKLKLFSHFNLNINISYLILLSLFFIILKPQISLAETSNKLEVTIKGNKKTKTNYIKKLVNICIKTKKIRVPLNNTEKSIQDFQSKLHKCLKDENLFHSIQVVYMPKLNILDISLQDKSSFVVAPGYSSSVSTNERYLSLYLLDSNVAGTGNMFALLATNSLENNLWTYGFIYSAINLDKLGKYGLSVIYFNRDIFVYSYVDTDWEFRFRQKFAFFWAILYDRIDPVLTIGYGYLRAAFEFSEHEYADEREVLNISDTFQTDAFNFIVTWDWTKYKNFYEMGRKVEINFLQQLHRTDNDVLDAGLIFQYYWGLSIGKKGRQVFQFYLNASHKKKTYSDEALLVGAEIGTRGIPVRGAWVQSYVNVSFNYQVAILETKLAYLTVGPHIDIGHLLNIQHHPEESLSYYGVGIGFYLYLKLLTVPAIGVYYTHNNEYHPGLWNLYIGLQI